MYKRTVTDKKTNEIIEYDIPEDSPVGKLIQSDFSRAQENEQSLQGVLLTPFSHLIAENPLLYPYRIVREASPS